MEETKPFFEVYEIRASKLLATQVNSDGSHYNEDTNVVGEDEVIEYAVYEYDGEYGTIENVSHYTISEYHDEQDQLEQIRADHDPSEWNCFNW